jgi:hypothetical protein
MGEMGWGITFVLVMASLVTVLLSALMVQYFKMARLKLELKAKTPRDQVDIVTAPTEQARNWFKLIIALHEPSP